MSALCECGCGSPTNPVPSRSARGGYMPGRFRRFVRGHAQRKFGGDPLRLIDRSDDDGCWIWTGPLTAEGYGRFGHAGAYRVVYELLVGPVPEGLELDHLCRVRSCVRPDHLEPVTHAENSRRGSMSKLTAAQAEEIRADPRRPLRLVAEDYGITLRHVQAIRAGQYWS